MKIKTTKTTKSDKEMVVKSSSDSGILKKVVRKVTRKTTKKAEHPAEEPAGEPVVSDKAVAAPSPSPVVNQSAEFCGGHRVQICRLKSRAFQLV